MTHTEAEHQLRDQLLEKLREENRRLKAECERARKRFANIQDLTLWISHLETCALKRHHGFTQCTCGLSDALKGKPE